jgi:hypothetical protein
MEEPSWPDGVEEVFLLGEERYYHAEPSIC